MRRPARWLSFVAAAVVMLLLAYLAGSFVVGRLRREKGITEYPLMGVDAEGDADYLIVRRMTINGKTQYAVCSDTQAIKKTKNHLSLSTAKRFMIRTT